MKRNLEDFEKCLLLVAIWDGTAQEEGNATLAQHLSAIAGWDDEERAQDAVEFCIANGLIQHE